VCGIAGIVSDQIHTVAMQNTLLSMSHRGPDDSGSLEIKVDKWHLLLGQTRLSIIDLSSKGNQPFTSFNQKFDLIFNGEIYNYKELKNQLISSGLKFNSESDTEVLLNAWIHWGVDCLSKLKGMFAFAIYNRSNGSLSLIRDAFGIKPIFYSEKLGKFAFASEPKALQNLISKSFKLNDQKMFNYLAFGSQSFGNETFFEDIKILEPGHILTINLTEPELKSRVAKWWQPDISQKGDISESKAIYEIRESFLENIQLHLRSDVPIGAALSGGIDSSSIVCAMHYIKPKFEINTFSYIASGSTKNEEFWVDIVNKHVKAKAHKVFVTPAELLSDLDELIKFQGEPFGSLSIYAQYRVYKLAKDSGVKVVLDGQGADELFAGYDGYPEWKFRSLIGSGNIFQAIDFLIKWSSGPDRSLVNVIEKSILTSVLSNKTSEFSRKFRKRKIPSNLFLLNEIEKNNIDTQISLNALKDIGWDRSLTSRLLHALTKTGLVDLLRYGDRNSMRWSVESRVPFLTTDFAEYVLRLPESFLVSQNGRTKDIFRKAMYGIVPNQILERKDKVGFETPELDWLKTLANEPNTLLEGLSEISWVNLNGAKVHFQEVLNGQRAFNWQSWRLINAAKWATIVLRG